jgi:hypothetical protein
MNSQEAVVCRAKKRFLGDGTRSLRGGGGREISNEAPLGVNAIAPPPMANGKENRDSSLAKTTQFQLRQYPEYSCEATQPAESELSGLGLETHSSVSLFRLPLRRTYHPSCGRCVAQLKR